MAGLNVAIVLDGSSETLPAIGLPPNGAIVKVRSLNVEASIARENVALGVAATSMPVAPSLGSLAMTVGGPVAVLKLHCTADTSWKWSKLSTVVERRAV